MTKNEKYIVDMYVRYFGRAADAATIANYAADKKTSVILKNIIADADAEKAELSTSDFVNNAFQNLFGRNATTKEMNKYSKVIEKGKNLPINSIVKSAAKADKAVYNNKKAVALKYAELGGTEQLDLSKISKGNLIDLKTVTTLADLQAKVDALPENNGVPSSIDGKTYILTASIDSGKDFVGTSKNDLFLAVDDSNAAKTLTLADSIDGGKGIDTLKIVTAGTIKNEDFSDNTIKGIEIVDIKSTNAGALTLDTTADAVKNNFKEVTDLNITTTDNIGAITATVNGTTNVTATATGAAATADITVNGGKAVSATLDILATATIKGDALTTVTVKGGTANVIDNLGTDVAATSGAGETLKSVTFEANAGTTATVNGNAIDTLTLKDQTTAAGLSTTIINTKSTALTVNLNNVINGGTASDVTAGVKAETITINSNGTKANELILVAGAGKTLNITGDAAFTLGTGTPATIKDIVSTNTKGVTITDPLAKDVKFTGGTGADTIELVSAFEKAITMGAGNDTVTYAGAASTAEGKVGSVDAGADKDTIIMTSTQASGITTDAFNTAFKNFEVLHISNALTGAIDVEKINNVSEVELKVDGNTNTISNLVSGGRVAFLAAAATGTSTNSLTVDVKNATTGTSDVLNLDLKGVVTSATPDVDFGTVTAAKVETINITAADINTTATGSAAEIAELVLVAVDATKVVVSGNNGLDLTNTGNTKITTFDASGVVSNGTTADLAADLAVTFTSANITAGEAVTIIGGAGDDKLTGTAQANDTITGGKGNDTITYTGGKDTFTGGEGADIFVIGAGAVGTKDLYLTITDFSGTGKDLDKINVSAISNGTGTFGTKIAVASGATFEQALDAAVKVGSGSTNGITNWFQFKGDTYVVVDNSNTDTYTAGVDSFIKITGTVDLVAGDFTL